LLDNVRSSRLLRASKAGILVADRLRRDGTVALPLDISVERRRIGLDHLGIVGRVSPNRDGQPRDESRH
jgi:hypothetical protein